MRSPQAYQVWGHERKRRRFKDIRRRASLGEGSGGVLGLWGGENVFGHGGLAARAKKNVGGERVWGGGGEGKNIDLRLDTLTPKGGRKRSFGG